VAAYLVPRIREVPPKSSTLTGGIASQYIQFLTKPKAFGQIISVSLRGGGRGGHAGRGRDVRALWVGLEWTL
jgi:hypothetical protein